MLGRRGALSTTWKPFGALSVFRSDRRAVAAIEFALIVPLLLSMYFVTMEVAQGVEANKKVGRVGSMVADLVTQQQATTVAELNAILSIGESTLQPYNRSKPSITITAIEITDETTPQVKVAWSRKLVNGATSAGAAKGSPTTVPNDLKIKGSFLVRVESALSYEPVITWTSSEQEASGLNVMGRIFEDGVLKMKETYFLRPRMSNTIPCSDC